MIWPALRQRQGDASTTSTMMNAILENERILTHIYNQVQANEISKLDYAERQFQLARLQMKAATNYSDDDDTVDNNTDSDINVSYVTLSTDDRIHLCQEAFEHITSCHDLLKMILPSTHKRVREANVLKEKAKALLRHLNRFRTFEIWIARKHYIS